jgi:glutamine amidotransferase
MQMLTRGSEEGALPGLGLIAATTRKFTQGENLKIPHMGWNAVQWQNLNSPLVRDLTDKARFYFVHSYYVSCDTPDISLATCTHGLQFSAAIAAGNIYGVQFHPEKSHTFGLRLLRNFLSV